MELNSTHSVIEKLGGISDVAKLTSRKYDAVWVWRKTNRFPSNTFLIIKSALADQGYSAPAELWGMAEAEQAAE